MSNADLDRNRPRFARIVAAGADYNHLIDIVQRCEAGEDWGKLWEEFGAMIEAIGDEALGQGRNITAGEAFAKAAVYFHTAQMTKHRDLPEKERLQRRQQSVYRKAMPYLRPPVQALDIPYKGSSFPGYLRLPLNARGPAPCVLMPRLKACVSLGGFFNSPWERFKEGSRREFAMVTHAKDLDVAGKIARDFTLDGILHKLKAPLLVVHSQGDTVTSYHEAEQIAREAGGPVELVLYPEGNPSATTSLTRRGR